MELKHLLSIATATLTGLAAILYSMGAPHALAPVALWMAATCALVVTDFLGAIRLPRAIGSILMWCALIVFVLHFLLTWDSRMMFAGHSPDWQLQNVVNVLMFLQCVLLFQEKDARAYGWLTVMSLLQVVVAARYSRGVAFGSLLIVYAVVGMFALSLLSLYAQRSRSRKHAFNPKPTATARLDNLRRRRWFRVKRGSQDDLAERDERIPRRWPLAGAEPDFSSAAVVSERAGIVPEFFARLSLVAAGGLLLATVIFYAVPRPRIPSFRGGDTQRSVSVVGFNEKILLGSLGDTMESREEVMRVQFLDPGTRQPYKIRTAEIYLRGAEVNWYSENEWFRLPPSEYQGTSRWAAEPNDLLPSRAAFPLGEFDPAFSAGPPVVQCSTLEPNVDRYELFYVWPIVERPLAGDVRYVPTGERLTRRYYVRNNLPQGEFTFEVNTGGLLDGRQVELIPARRNVRREPLLQMPTNRSAGASRLPGRDASLPRLTALAVRWRTEAGLTPQEHEKIARLFERQLSSSGQFHYSLQPVERDERIDAIEDFVSNHPSGHCEYFATALALMLRSQGIPSRVVLGYRCDEWDPRGQCFQVRQLHAHAWVEAYLDPAHLDLASIPQPLRGNDPRRWSYGGWLRLDGVPADDLGTAAADSTMWGAWEARLHAVQHYWERYIADMDNKKQRESVYEPIRRAVGEFTRGLFSWSAWREAFAGVWGALARTFHGGIMGTLLGGVLLLAAALALGLVGWRLMRVAMWLWRRLFGGGRAQSSKARASVEFYRRFEQVAADFGLLRLPGETPREFARATGKRLATVSGRPELAVRAAEVAEAFYVVRFGRQELDAATAADIRHAMEELQGCRVGQTSLSEYRPTN